MRVIHFLVNYSSNLFIECHTSSSPTNVIIETDHIWNHAGKIGSKLESAPVIDVEEPQIRLQLLPVSIKHIFVIQSWITLSVNPLLFGTIIQKWEKVCLDGLFLTSAVSWVGVRAKVTGCWNCYKENLAAALSQPLENNFKLWCKIYWEPLPGNSGRHAHQVNSQFLPQTSALLQWNGTDSNSEHTVMCQTPLQKEDYKVLKPKNRPHFVFSKNPERNIMKAYFINICSRHISAAAYATCQTFGIIQFFF